MPPSNSAFLALVSTVNDLLTTGDPRRHLRPGTIVDVLPGLGSRKPVWRGVIVGATRFTNGAAQDYLVRRKNGNRPFVSYTRISVVSPLDVFVQRMQ